MVASRREIFSPCQQKVIHKKEAASYLDLYFNTGILYLLFNRRQKNWGGFRLPALTRVLLEDNFLAVRLYLFDIVQSDIHNGNISRPFAA